MVQKKFNTKELLEAINYLRSNYTNSDNIQHYSKSPIHILVHDEIVKYTKEEIDNSEDNTKEGYNLFNISFVIANPYIFSAFLETGAFQNKISDESKWILNQTKKPNDEIYELVYQVEEARVRRTKYSNNDVDCPYKNDYLFNCLFNTYNSTFYKLDTPTKIEIVDQYIRDFGKEKEKSLIYFIKENYEDKKVDLCKYLVMKMHKNNADFCSNDYLNKFLPKKRSDEGPFFISSSHIPKVKNLLEAGYRFNEKNYSYGEDNLFVAVLKSKRVDIVETIIPYLSDITPKSGTLLEQNQFVENFANNAGEDLGRLIKRNYNKLLLEHELKDKDENTSTNRKLKI